MVVGQHSYVTLGNSEWEHFGPAGVLDAERTEYNCETCNVYNMLKLTRLLFCLTGKNAMQILTPGPMSTASSLPRTMTAE